MLRGIEVSPDALRKETVQTLREVNATYDWVKEQPDNRRTKDHPLMLAMLLGAKAQCLNTLTLLNEKR